MLHYQPRQDLLNGKTILITGATDGIGQEAALTYARFGAAIILLGRNSQKLKAVKQQIINSTGASVETYVIDLLTATEATCQAIADDIAKQHPYLDGVLHSAGLLGNIAPISEQPTQLWHDVMQVNVNAGFMLTQALLPLLEKTPHASLIFTSSSVGKQGRANWGVYAVSKFATEGLMQVLADEYQGTGLRINCINPGRTRTAMRAGAAPGEDPMTLKTPADIMPTYLYLMGDDSAEQTGTSVDAQPNLKPIKA